MQDRASRFATTDWGAAVAARSGTASGVSALDSLCATYWYPLYAYLRRSGESPEDASDLVQGFLAQAIDLRLFQRAEPRDGKLRSLLLAALRNFRLNERRNASTLKRGGGTPILSLDAIEAEERLAHEPSHNATPERLFERGFALQVIQTVFDRLRAEQAALGLADRFDLLSPQLVLKDPVESYAQLGGRLGLSEGATRTAMYRLRCRCRELFREELSLLLGDDMDLEDELRHLIGAFEA